MWTPLLMTWPRRRLTSSPMAGGTNRFRGGTRRRGGPEGGSSGGPTPGSSADSAPDADPESVARAIALRRLTMAPRSRAQLADALARREVPLDVAGTVLDRFEDVGLVDDAGFAEAWVRSRHAGRGLARRALAAELRDRRVDKEVVDDALAGLDSDDERAMAFALVRRRLGSTRGVEPTRRAKRLVGMLARKGYPAGMAYAVVRQALAEEGEDAEGLDEPDESA